MVTAIILLNIEGKKVKKTAEYLASLSGISECYSVGGNYDLVCVARVTNNEDLANLVTEEITPMDGIIKTETLIAFKTHSRYDLERMFSIGD